MREGERTPNVDILIEKRCAVATRHRHFHRILGRGNYFSTDRIFRAPAVTQYLWTVGVGKSLNVLYAKFIISRFVQTELSLSEKNSSESNESIFIAAPKTALRGVNSECGGFWAPEPKIRHF